MAKLNSRLSNSTPFRHVKSYGAFHIYKRQPNQTATYILVVGGKQKHQGSKKYIFSKFMEYSKRAIFTKFNASANEMVANLKTLNA